MSQPNVPREVSQPNVPREVSQPNVPREVSQPNVPNKCQGNEEKCHNQKKKNLHLEKLQ